MMRTDFPNRFGKITLSAITCGRSRMVPTNKRGATASCATAKIAQSPKLEICNQPLSRECHFQAEWTMSSMPYRGSQRSTVRATSLLATNDGGSPGRRSE